MCISPVKTPQRSVSKKLSYRSVSKREILFSFCRSANFLQMSRSCSRALHMLERPPTMTAGGNMLSAIMENSGHSRVGVIHPGSASARYEDPRKYLPPAHQRHFPT